MKRIRIDGERIKTREQLIASLKEQAALEDFIGNNLDAFHDALSELSEKPEIELLHYGALKEHLGAYADRFLRALSDGLSSEGEAAAENGRVNGAKKRIGPGTKREE